MVCEFRVRCMELCHGARDGQQCFAKLRQYFSKTSGFNSENELNAIYRYLVHMKETANGKANSGDVVFADGGVSYSIAYTTDNKPVAVIDEDILDGVPKSQWIQTVKDTILGKFSDGIPISGRLIKVNQKTRNEYTNSKNCNGMLTIIKLCMQINSNLRIILMI